ncbi:MAG: SpoIID/LytB domain-containing protein [Gaiellaceae bacterium]
MIKRLALTFAAFAALALAGSAGAAPVFVITGFGWGHGVGLSQYGAAGLAARGSTHDQILAHYYRKTSLGAVDGARMRVLVHVPARKFTISSAAVFSVRGADGTEFALPAGPVTITKKLAVVLAEGKQAFALPLTFEPGDAPLEVAGRAYRGLLTVHDTADGVLVVNDVGLEQYLYGVVPDEMPPAWELEALKAQAVAARSYALATRKTAGVFDAYADTRSQVYGGLASEHPRATQAVEETRGQVVLHGGAVATTFFFSTSGGRTAAVEDVWRGAAPSPYLRAVADPTDAPSPFHRWGPLVLGRRALQRALAEEAPRGVHDVTITSNPSGRVDLVVMTGKRAQKAIDGATARTKLGLRSTGFDVGVLDIESPEGAVGFGKRVPIRGTARGVAGAVLQERTGASWTRVRKVAPRADGSFVVRYRPRAGTVVRLTAPQLSASNVRAPQARVAVIARASLERKRRGVFQGVVRPKDAGTPVELQRLGKRRWRTVARAETADAGRFRFRLKPRPAGDYRVVATPERDAVGAGVSETESVPR